MLDHTCEAVLANIKLECQRWPEKLLILGRCGTQYVAMVAKLLSSFCGAHLVESYRKESNISDMAEISLHHIWSKFNWVYVSDPSALCTLVFPLSLQFGRLPSRLLNDRYFDLQTSILPFKLQYNTRNQKGKDKVLWDCFLLKVKT